MEKDESGRKTLSPSQVAVLRERVRAYQDTIVGHLPSPIPRVGPAVMLYLTSLILEAEVTSHEDTRIALLQRRSALGKLAERLRKWPTVEDLDAHLQTPVPFDAGLRDFLRADLEAGPEG